MREFYKENGDEYAKYISNLRLSNIGIGNEIYSFSNKYVYEYYSLSHYYAFGDIHNYPKNDKLKKSNNIEFVKAKSSFNKVLNFIDTIKTYEIDGFNERIFTLYASIIDKKDHEKANNERLPKIKEILEGKYICGFYDEMRFFFYCDECDTRAVGSYGFYEYSISANATPLICVNNQKYNEASISSDCSQKVDLCTLSSIMFIDEKDFKTLEAMLKDTCNANT